MTLPTVCAGCGTPRDRATACPNCPPPRDHAARDQIRGTRQQRGYDAAWDRLSARARRLQPFCTDCGRTDQLTADHSPTAWTRHAAGQPIRLDDIDVVCTPCNNRRGAARGPNATERPTIAAHRAALNALASIPQPPCDQGGRGTEQP